MATQVTNYQCPACTGPLHFSGESGKLECEYCGSSYTVEYIEQLFAQKNKEAAGNAKQEQEKTNETQGEWDFATHTDWDANMKAYSCPSCGAELICDETTAATSCPYCGNPTVIPGQFSGGMKPELIIPFKLDKNAAVAALKRHYGGKKLLPKVFADQNHLEEVKGVYVPFWLFDSVADTKTSFVAENVRTYTQGDYEITETDHFLVRREGTVPFERVPADASTKMPDDYMDSIEPYDYKELKPFSTAYLPGFLADRYDVEKSECGKRADERATNTAVDEMRRTVKGYAMVHLQSEHVNLKRGKAHYALMPVWLLSTRWNEKNYLFAMNGQTGKLVGDLPIDKRKMWLWLLGIAVGVSAVANVLLGLIG